MGVLELSIWGGAGVSVLVCTRGVAFENDWWKFVVFQWQIISTWNSIAGVLLN